MNQLRSIPLILLISLLILPWKAIDLCIAHPGGHNYDHKPGELTPCEQREVAEGTNVWPPRHCDTLVVESDHYQVPPKVEIHPPTDDFGTSPIVVEIDPHFGQEILFKYLFTSNSDPPDEPHFIRGPPMSFQLGRNG